MSLCHKGWMEQLYKHLHRYGWGFLFDKMIFEKPSFLIIHCFILVWNLRSLEMKNIIWVSSFYMKFHSMLTLDSV